MSRAHPTSAVVFDLDGTLVDSMPLVLQSIAYAIEPYGPARTATEIFTRLGGPPERFMPAFLRDPRDTASAVKRMMEFHHENHHLIRPFEGAGEMLKRLRGRGITAGIWTGRDRNSTEWLLAHHGLTSFFDDMVCGDDLPSHKPDSAGLREIMRRLNLTAPATLYVGDADVDVIGGVGCAVDTLLIHHQRTIDEAVLAQSWRVVATPPEAYAVVLSCVN